MTTLFPEPIHAGEAIVSEANGRRSRAAVTIAAGSVLAACSLLALLASGMTATATAGTNTGNGAMGAITVEPGAQVGTYMLRITKAATNAGDFEVLDPEGDVVGLGSVAAAFNAGGLSFTLADGATDFVVGDTFKIAVTGAGKYVAFDPTATTGAQNPSAMLIWPAGDADVDVEAAAIVRDAELNDLSINWPTGITDNQKAAAIVQLAQFGIIVRS
jgi:hypothetical protein